MLETKIATKLTGQSKVEADGKTVVALTMEANITEEGANVINTVTVNKSAYVANLKTCRADEDAFRQFVREREDKEVSDNEK